MAMLRYRTTKVFLSLLFALLVAGCQQKIDGSNDESYKASIEKISGSLPDDQRNKFRMAVTVVTVRFLSLDALLKGKVSTVTPAMREALDGKTAAEVIRMGDEVRAQSDAKRAGLKHAKPIETVPPVDTSLPAPQPQS